MAKRKVRDIEDLLNGGLTVMDTNLDSPKKSLSLTEIVLCSLAAGQLIGPVVVLAACAIGITMVLYYWSKDDSQKNSE